MKKLLSYIFIISACFILFGCQQSSGKDHKETNEEQNEEESEGNDMGEKDIFNFKHIDKAPETTEKHSINEVIKVYFSQSTIDGLQAAAIDVENNEIYDNPVMGRRGLRANNGVVEVNDAEKVLDILDKYEIQNWETDYTFEDPDTYTDGYSWKLWVQFKDGTVEKHSGQGTDKEKLIPKNYDDFTKELNDFVAEKLKENE